MIFSTFSIQRPNELGKGVQGRDCALPMKMFDLRGYFGDHRSAAALQAGVVHHNRLGCNHRLNSSVGWNAATPAIAAEIVAVRFSGDKLSGTTRCGKADP
jgi:hypothetical protein